VLLKLDFWAVLQGHHLSVATGGVQEAVVNTDLYWSLVQGFESWHLFPCLLLP